MTDGPQVPEQYKDIPGVFCFTLAGRDMWLKRPGPGPLVLLQRYQAQLAHMKRTSDPGYVRLVVDVTAKTLNVIDNQFLDLDDKLFVEDLILNEKVGIQDVIPALSGSRGRPEQADDAEVEVVPKIVRAKKAATVVKKTASVKRARS